MVELANQIQNIEHRWRTLIHVQRIIGNKPETSRVQATVPGWDSRKRLSFPFRSLPEAIQSEVGKDTMLFARVDMSADKGSQLQPSDFELGPTEEEVRNSIGIDDPDWLKVSPEVTYKDGWWEEDPWGTGVEYRKFPDGIIREIRWNH